MNFVLERVRIASNLASCQIEVFFIAEHELLHIIHV
jgi:hypothetical protein